MFTLVVMLFWSLSVSQTTLPGYSSLAECQAAGETYKRHIPKEHRDHEERDYICLEVR